VNNYGKIAEYGLSVKFLSNMLENLYEGTSSTVFMQNYFPTDQRINHMVTHIVSRKKGDLEKNDMIYGLLKTHDKGFVEEYNAYLENPESMKEKMDELSQMAQVYRKYLAEHPDSD